LILARVGAPTWATVKHAAYDGRIVFSVQPEPAGAPFLAVDAVGARTGTLVLVAREGNCARQVLNAHEQPVHSVIVAIVDQVEPG
jgi:microcompartment protein CcmK/EutM